MQRRSNIKFKNIGLVGCASLLCLLVVTLMVPLVPSSAYADESAGASEGNTRYQTSTVGIELTPEKASATIIPVSDNGESGKNKIDVAGKVTVTNSTGYDVYIGSTSAELTNTKEDKVVATVETVDTDYAYSELPINKWGYAYIDEGGASQNSTVYSAMPTGQRGEIIYDKHEDLAKDGSDTKEFTLSFAANIGTNKPSGIYSNDVVVSVISSPKEVTVSNGFGDVDTLQKLTVAKCQQVTTPTNVDEVPTVQLRDERDDKMYWVSKMPDGNCWMVQNLDLDIPSGTISSSSNQKFYNGSQMSASWTPTAATTTNVTQTSSTATDSRSWGQGLYVFVNPKNTSSCAGSDSGNQGLSYSNCSDKFQNVSSGWTASTDPDFASKSSYKGTDNSTDCSKTEGYALNQSAPANCKIYDAHYLVGNWYQWIAATAGTGTGLSSSNANTPADVTQSICPTNWRLPASGGSSSTTPLNQNYSFGKLLTTTINWVSSTTSVDDLTSAPLFFVRSGLVHSTSGGYLNSPGSTALYWSSTAYTTTDLAYRLSFDSGTNVYPSGGGGRYLGYSVRCLVPAATS